MMSSLYGLLGLVSHRGKCLNSPLVITGLKAVLTKAVSWILS
nr:MAG TPA: hypothetical protein [Caudoviricetes sp.]